MPRVKPGAVLESPGFREYLAVEAAGAGFDGLVDPQVQGRGVGILFLVHLAL